MSKLEANKSLKVYRKFVEGLSKLGLTLEEVSATWKYVGGNRQKRHVKYWKLVYGLKPFPPYERHCVCEHEIVENCYITDGNGRILVVGNCCIEHFLENSGRTCEVCGAPHRNRIVNRCKQCRIGRCDRCGVRCPHNCKLCFLCKMGYKSKCENCGEIHFNKSVNRCDTCRIGICDECGKKCRPCFEKCYTCAYR